MEKKLFVVEKECPQCGCPIGEGIVNVREAREGDEFAPRQMTGDEIPGRWEAAATAADPDMGIILYRSCQDCRD